MAEPVENPSDYSPRLRQDFFERMAARRGRIKWMGWFAIALGVLAVLFPFAASLSVNIFVAAMMLITGITMAWTAFSMSGWHLFWQLAGGLLAIAAGLIMAFFPILGVFWITMLLAAVFFVEGGTQIWTAFRIRPHKGWGWMAASGVVSILVALLILFALPFSLGVLGLFLGFNLLMTGVALVTLSGQLTPEKLAETFPDKRRAD